MARDNALVILGFAVQEDVVQDLGDGPPGLPRVLLWLPVQFVHTLLAKHTPLNSFAHALSSAHFLIFPTCCKLPDRPEWLFP